MTEKNMKNFHNSVLQELSKYYFDKLWKTYGIVLLMLCVNIMLIFVTKSRETRFIINLDEYIESQKEAGRVLEHVPPSRKWWEDNQGLQAIGTMRKFDNFYICQWVLDLIILVHLFIVRHHTIMWEQV